MTAYDKWSMLDEAKFNADLQTSAGITLTVWEKLDHLAKVKRVAAAESVNWRIFSELDDKKLAYEANANHV